MGRRPPPHQEAERLPNVSDTIRLVLTAAFHVSRPSQRLRKTATASPERLRHLARAVRVAHAAMLGALGDDAVVLRRGKAPVTKRDLPRLELLRSLTELLRSMPPDTPFKDFVGGIATLLAEHGVEGGDVARRCRRAAGMQHAVPRGGPRAFMRAARGPKEFAKRLLSELGQRPRYAEYAEAELRAAAAGTWSAADQRAFDAAWGTGLRWRVPPPPPVALAASDLDGLSLGWQPRPLELAEQALLALKFPRERILAALKVLRGRR
jgi:hypothetical protein